METQRSDVVVANNCLKMATFQASLCVTRCSVMAELIHIL